MLRRIGAEEGGEFKAVASGTLPSGRPVVVNADGTVSVVSETSEGFGSETVFATTSFGTIDNAVTYDTNAQKIVIAYGDRNNSDALTAVVGTVSGTSISFGTPVVAHSGSDVNYVSIAYDANAQKVVVVYKNTANSNYGTAVVGTVSGTSISFGTAVVFESAVIDYTGITYDANAQKVVIVYKDDGNSNYGTAIVGTVSGTSISFGTAVVFESASTVYPSVTYDSNAQKVVVAYKDVGAGNIGTAIVGTVSGTSISFGTAVVFANNNVDYIKCAFDSSNNKVVIVYGDAANSDYGTAIVGTVSGTSISFGTEVVYAAAWTQINQVAYDTSAGKIVIVFKDRGNSSHGTLITGTVSGTSISFGTEQVFNAATTNHISIAYDSSQEKIVVAYKDEGNSNYATAIVFQNESTNLTSENYIGMSRGVAATDTRSEAIGSPTVFETGEPSSITTAYDSSNNRVVISYRDGGNNFYATTVVGTVSGTSISFGTPVVFNSENSNYITNVFDSNAGKVVTFYTTSLGYPSAKVGTVSGTSISYGSATTIISSSHSINGATFDSTNNKVIIGHGSAGGGNTNVRVGTVSGTSITFGSATTTETTYLGAMGFDSTNGKVVLALYTLSNGGRAYVGTVSGTSISFGSAVQFNSNIGDLAGVAHDSNSGKTVIGYRKGGGQAAAIVGTVSGTSISFGSETEVQTSNTTNVGMGFDSRVNKIIYAYRYGPSPYNGRLRVGTVSGTSISFDSEVTFESGETSNLSPTSIAFDSTENVVIIGYKDAGDSNKAKAVVYQAAGSFVNRAEVADGGNASIDIIGSVSDNQLSLTAGQQYFVQTDGTISTTADDPSVLAGTAISATELVVKT